MSDKLGWIDTPSGHILMCLVAVVLGAGLLKFGVPEGKELVAGGTACLFMAMRGLGGKPKGVPDGQ